MVKIRLMRMGAKKRPFFRVVVADSRSPRDGRFIENIGKYHPLNDPSVIEIDEDRALHWLGTGALPTEAVKVLMHHVGIWEKFKPGEKPRERAERGPRRSKKAVAAAAAEQAAAAAPAEEQAPAPEQPVAEQPAAEAPAAEAPAAEAPAAEEPAAEPPEAEEQPAAPAAPEEPKES